MIIFVMFLSREETTTSVSLPASSQPKAGYRRSKSSRKRRKPARDHPPKWDKSQIAGPSAAVESNNPAHIQPEPPTKKKGRPRKYTKCTSIGVEAVLGYLPTDIAIHLMNCGYVFGRLHGHKSGMNEYVQISLSFIL
jgi:hypothetical protein